MEEKQESKDIILEVHDSIVGWDEITGRAVRRAEKEIKPQEEDNGKASS